MAETASTLRVLVAAVLVAVLGACGTAKPPPELVIGASAEPDSVLLANIYAAALRYYGTPVRVERFDDPIAALDSGAATIAPGWTGRLLARFSPGTLGRSDAGVYRQLVGVLPEGVVAGDYTTAAEDKPAVAVTEATAESWGGRYVSTLVKKCAQLRPGKVRGGVGGPRRIDTCTLPAAREFDDQRALFAALRAGRVNAAWTSTADPGVPADVVLLDDKKPALIRAQNAVPLYRRNELGPQQVVALNEVAGVLDTAALKKMRAGLADGAEPRVLADAWLAENPIGN